MLSNSLRADLIMRSLANQAAKLQRCFVKSPIYIRGLTETPVFILCQVPKHEKLVFYPNAEPFFFFCQQSENCNRLQVANKNKRFTKLILDIKR